MQPLYMYYKRMDDVGVLKNTSRNSWQYCRTDGFLALLGALRSLIAILAMRFIPEYSSRESEWSFLRTFLVINLPVFHAWKGKGRSPGRNGGEFKNFMSPVILSRNSRLKYRCRF